jgi:hypothetical protein
LKVCEIVIFSRILPIQPFHRTAVNTIHVRTCLTVQQKIAGFPGNFEQQPTVWLCAIVFVYE